MFKLMYSCTSQYQIQKFLFGKFSTSFASGELFNGVKDIYKGITIDTKNEKVGSETFSKTLEESLSYWRTQGQKCIWFRVNISDAYCVPILAQQGFNFHHARDDFVMMYKWLPKNEEKENLPPPCHTNLGVGAMVFNNKDCLLAISEKHYEYPHWKLPGGYVDRGEDIIAAAVREVKEETGIIASFESVVTFRHTHNMMFGNSDIYIILMMNAITDEITKSEREVNHCQWMAIEEYINHPHVHKFNRLIVKKALEYKEQNLKLDFQKKRVKWATNVRDMNYLVIGDMDYDD